MKFSCNKNSLLNEIAVAQGIISSRNTMSILSNVLLEVKDGNLYIKATDLKIGYETFIPVNMEDAGSTTVYCDKLLSVLRTFPDGDIKFKSEGQAYYIHSSYLQRDYRNPECRHMYIRHGPEGRILSGYRLL